MKWLIRPILLCLLLAPLVVRAQDDLQILNSLLTERQAINIGHKVTLYLTITGKDDRFITRLKIEAKQPGGRFHFLQFLDLAKICITEFPGAAIVSFTDYNFDGYLDMDLGCWAGATGNAGGVALAYSPVRHRFMRHRELNYLHNAEADATNRSITMHSHVNYCDSQTEIYRWHGKKLRLEVIDHQYEIDQPERCENISDCNFTTIATFSQDDEKLMRLRCYQGERGEKRLPATRINCAPLLAKIKKYRYIPPWSSLKVRARPSSSRHHS